MILFDNPKATRVRNRRFPPSVLAMAAVRRSKEEYAIVDGNLDPIVWGGYFASNYTPPVLNAEYVDYAVRGQREQTFLELLEANSRPSRS
jgi:anaerobic magnesium-protoporphyrin IX monomethyl ester cyclase